MTSLPNGLPEGWTENANHDLVSKEGVIILAEERTECEVFSRIIGYLRPVAQWNVAKKAEWRDRVTFDVPKNLKERLAPKIESGGDGKGGSDA